MLTQGASAIQILAEVCCLADDMNPKEWVAYAGLDPRVIESGTSLNKPRRISKAGNKHLRAALYMPAWVAVRSEPTVRKFHETLVNAGKHKLQAIVAVMRKILHAIWGMFQSGEPWDSTKFYSCKQ